MEKGLYGMAGEQLAFIAGHAAAAEACAAELEAAGCICELSGELEAVWRETEAQESVFGPGEELIEHDARCPIALAAKLREMGR